MGIATMAGARGKGREATGRKLDRGVASDPSPLASRHLPPTGVRLQKVIADSGLTSRRKAEQFILAARVTVNGRVVRELGTKVNPQRDHVKVDGRHLKPAPPQVLVMMNKPKGHLSSMADPLGRPTVQDLLGGVRVRVFPVGRLDFDGEGLMLLTNDGELAQALLHPRYHVSRTYLIKVKGMLNDQEIDTLSTGVELEDGLTAPAVVEKVRKAPQNSWLEITIYEGRQHQVKRMLEAVGHPVLRLKRVRFGSLTLGDLAVGRYRYLSDHEANALRSLARRRLAHPENKHEARGERRVSSSESRVPSPRKRFKSSRPATLRHSKLETPNSKLRSPKRKPDTRQYISRNTKRKTQNAPLRRRAS